MVNAIKHLIEFIEKNKLKPMKKWSERIIRKKNSNEFHHKSEKMIKQIRCILNLLSGNDILPMLKGF
jgi:hypothetical protein